MKTLQIIIPTLSVALALAVSGCSSMPSGGASSSADGRPEMPGNRTDLGFQNTPWGQKRVIFGMTATSRSRPVYPLSMKRQGIQGEVVLDALVDASGIPVEVHVFHSSGHSAFDQSASAALMQWVFDPWIEAGQAVEVVVRQRIAFTIAFAR